jgi:hypothetical protein
VAAFRLQRRIVFGIVELPKLLLQGNLYGNNAFARGITKFVKFVVVVVVVVADIGSVDIVRVVLIIGGSCKVECTRIRAIFDVEVDEACVVVVDDVQCAVDAVFVIYVYRVSR